MGKRLDLATFDGRIEFLNGMFCTANDDGSIPLNSGVLDSAHIVVLSNTRAALIKRQREEIARLQGRESKLKDACTKQAHQIIERDEKIGEMKSALKLIKDQPREGDIPQQVVRMQRIAKAALGK